MARPFFAYVATNAPHTPLDCPREYETLYAGKVRPNEAKFFGMITNMDDNVGRLLAQLVRWGIERDTLVVFMNDNGGTEGVKVFNAKMRGQKATPWMGGTRAASFWRWPGTITPGDRKQLAAHVDLFPTLAALAARRFRASLPPGSTAAVSCRRCTMQPRRGRTVFFSRTSADGNAARRRSPSIGCAPSAGGSTTRCRRTRDRDSLGNCSTSKRTPARRHDVAAGHPHVVRQIDAAYDQWWSDILPCLENENVPLAPVNAFNAAYRRQPARLQ